MTSSAPRLLRAAHLPAQSYDRLRDGSAACRPATPVPSSLRSFLLWNASWTSGFHVSFFTHPPQEPVAITGYRATQARNPTLGTDRSVLTKDRSAYAHLQHTPSERARPKRGFASADRLQARTA